MPGRPRRRPSGPGISTNPSRTGAPPLDLELAMNGRPVRAQSGGAGIRRPSSQMEMRARTTGNLVVGGVSGLGGRGSIAL
nr:unnamed protein product [Digitaria exilis]